MQLPNRNTVPSIEFSAAKGNVERKKEVEDTMLDPLEPFTEGPDEHDASSSSPTAGGAAKHEVVKENSLRDCISSVVTDAGGDTLAGDTKSKKGIVRSQPRGNHNVFTHHPRDPNYLVCKKTPARARCRIKPKKRGSDCTFYRSQNSERGE